MKDRVVFRENAVEKKIPYPNEWRIYRITYDFYSPERFRMFVDENPDAVLVGTAGESVTNKYVKWGDNAGDQNTAFLIDWMVWDTTAAYAPGEGFDLPYAASKNVHPAPMLNIYDGSVMPTEAGFSEGDVADPNSDIVKEIIADTSIVGNHYFRFYAPTQAATTTYGVNFNEGGLKTGTFIFRARALPGLDMNMTYDISTGTVRDVVRMYPPGRIKFDKSGDAADIRNLELTAWHIYRVTFEKDTFRLYLDERTEPLFLGTGEASTEKFLKWGDGSDGKQSGFELDWMVFDTNYIHAPGTWLPDTLSLNYDQSGIATLKEIKVAGSALAGFAPDVLSYNIELADTATVTPLIEYTVNHYFAVASLTAVNTVPSTATIKVTAENGTVQNYVLNFTVATGIDQLKSEQVNIYPNPVSDKLTIEVPSLETIMTIRVKNILGQDVILIRSDKAVTTIDLSPLIPGLYYINLDAENLKVIRKIIRK
jgi:hypothetical protein